MRRSITVKATIKKDSVKSVKSIALKATIELQHLTREEVDARVQSIKNSLNDLLRQYFNQSEINIS